VRHAGVEAGIVLGEEKLAAFLLQRDIAFRLGQAGRLGRAQVRGGHHQHHCQKAGVNFHHEVAPVVRICNVRAR
jgi:hypothetical protein